MLGPSVMIVRTPRHHTSAAIGGMPAESCLVASEHAGACGYGRRIEEFPCAHLRKGSAFRVVLDRNPEHPASLPSSTVCLSYSMLGPAVMIVRTPRHHTSAAIGGMP